MGGSEMRVPEQARITHGPMRSNRGHGNNGAFEFYLSTRTKAICIASDGEGWEHVSVHMVSDGQQRTPTWAEMCKIKDLFWEEEETVIQFHPPRSEYVNNHKHCLHLWRPIGKEIMLPPSELVGIKP